MNMNDNDENEKTTGNGTDEGNGTNPGNLEFTPNSQSASNQTESVLHQSEPDDVETTTDTYTQPWREPVYRESKDLDSRAASENFYQERRLYNWTDHDPAKNEFRKSKSGSVIKIICIILACVLLSATAAYGVVEYRINNGDFNVTNQVVLGSDNITADSSDEDLTTSISDDGQTMSSADLYDMACEQVVGVNTEVTTNVFGQTSSTAVSGSGFIISTDGYIITNYHVIEYAVEYGYELTVILYDGTSYEASIIGYEEDNDVAVIKIDTTGLNAVTLGSSDDMSVGDTVYAVGNPLGELSYTMTGGIISALDRLISSDASTTINMFQIDAAVNSGNSGGPIYNTEGEVIGIVTAKYSSTGVEGLGFAIPINDVVDIVSELIENGYVSGKAYMGIMVGDVTSSVAEYYSLVEGAYVTSIEPGSCAETAGLQVGDIITALGDTTVTSTDTLKEAKKNYSAGDTTTMTVYRAGETLELTITFDEEINSSSADSSPDSENQTPSIEP